MIYGLDVSNHQGNMSSLGGVAAKFFITKLTEGTSYTDPNAEYNLNFARSKGITLLGGYHYIRAGNGSGQARAFARRAKQLLGSNLKGPLWQLDCEADASFQDVKDFINEWNTLSGHAPMMFYTGDWWAASRNWNVAALGFAGLWSAPNRGYVGKAQNVLSTDWIAGYFGFKKITILQYDARSSVGDTNKFDGTLADLKKLCAGTTTTPSRPKEDDDDMIISSYGLGKSQDVAWGENTTLSWGIEYSDPEHAHANPGQYPGYIPPKNGYLDHDITLRISGLQAPDKDHPDVVADYIQVYVTNYKWVDGKAAEPSQELIFDGRATTGDSYVRPRGLKYSHKGDHVYVSVVCYNEGDPNRPAPKVASATWRVGQY